MLEGRTLAEPRKFLINFWTINFHFVRANGMKLLNEQIKIHSLCCTIVSVLCYAGRALVRSHWAVSIIMNDGFLIAIKKQPRPGAQVFIRTQTQTLIYKVFDGIEQLNWIWINKTSDFSHENENPAEFNWEIYIWVVLFWPKTHWFGLCECVSAIRNRVDCLFYLCIVDEWMLWMDK